MSSVPALGNTKTRPTWVEVSASALQHNFRTLQDYCAPEATVLAVVKADGYGHGGVQVARALEKEGALWFGVTSTDEGIELRQGGVSGRILLMTGFWRGEEETVVQYDLTPAVWEWWHIELLEDAADRLKHETVPVHVKVDTGMARLGLPMADLGLFCQMLKDAQHVVAEGLFSHLASSEVIDAPDVDAQIARFDDAATTVIESGLSPVYYHMANSAAIATRPRTWKNMVRPGLALYGYYLPFLSAVTGMPDASLELPVKPALTWKTRIIATREVPAHTPIGYNGAYVTQSPTRLAVLPVGYADGFSRQLSSRGRVIVRDDYAAIVGNVAMDLTTIDITGIPGVDVGDEVILLGASARRKITAWELASHASTVPYEVLCGISRRVPRRYVE
ncbi:MAG TPA: alanine racemase [Terriglobales bacterium]|nr:alanine racemase [Terriglobales bacterium]